MAEFVYNNIIQSLTQQTPFFANHGLHPKFNIQCVQKIMNLTIKDQTMYLVNVQAQLVCNLEKTHRRYKENVDECQNEQFSFKVGTKFGFDNNVLRQQGH
jgi:hypothetical protein